MAGAGHIGKVGFMDDASAIPPIAGPGSFDYARRQAAFQLSQALHHYYMGAERSVGAARISAGRCGRWLLRDYPVRQPNCLC